MRWLFIFAFLIAGLACFSEVTFADSVRTTEIERPYDVITLAEDLYIEQYWLGKLDEYPVMYGVEVQATTTITISLLQKITKKDLKPLTLMIVRRDDRGGGVTEIARYKPEVNQWHKQKLADFGMTLLEAEKFQKVIGPGTYQIEVSTPTNQNTPFLLIVGEESPMTGFFEVIKNTRLVQEHFGHSIFSIFRSPYIAYPLGIIFLIVGMIVTWRYRERIGYRM
jgi:hypothetical protein